jgi:hypothetical protein
VSWCFPTVRHLTTDFSSRQVECDTRAARTLEALIVDEAVYPLQDRLQAFRQIEVEVELFPLGMNFEDH